MRQPKPWFRSFNNSWYVQHNGRQHPLGVHPEGYPPPKKSKAGWNAPQPILDGFYKLMASDPSTLPKAKDLLTSQPCDLFLDHAQKHNEPDTYEWYRRFLQSFCDVNGRLPAKDLRPIHVTRWLDRQSWKGGRRNAVIIVKRAFNWADQQGVIGTARQSRSRNR